MNDTPEMLGLLWLSPLGWILLGAAIPSPVSDPGAAAFDTVLLPLAAWIVRPSEGTGRDAVPRLVPWGFVPSVPLNLACPLAMFRGFPAGAQSISHASTLICLGRLLITSIWASIARDKETDRPKLAAPVVRQRNDLAAREAKVRSTERDMPGGSRS